jgi:dipeptidase D
MTSNNLGVVEIEGGNAVLTSMFRTSDLSDEDDLISLFEELIGDSGQMDVLRSSRPWEFVEDSPLRDAMTEVYIQLFGRQPNVVAVHAGQEPSIFASSIPGSDMISIGPDIFDLHTPDERMNIPSFHRMANFMVLVLEAL